MQLAAPSQVLRAVGLRSSLGRTVLTRLIGARELGVAGYDLFVHKKDGCIEVVLSP